MLDEGVQPNLEEFQAAQAIDEMVELSDADTAAGVALRECLVRLSEVANN